MITVRVLLSGPSSQLITVDLHTINGSAINGGLFYNMQYMW